MKYLFQKGKISDRILENRLEHFVTYEGMASLSVDVTNDSINLEN